MTQPIIVAVDPRHEDLAAAALGVEPLALEYVRRAHQGTAEMALEEGLREVSDERSDGGRLLSGAAADARARASHDLDLLVCGSRGYGPVRSAMVGTTAHALVRHAECPVVVVPPEHHHDRR